MADLSLKTQMGVWALCVMWGYVYGFTLSHSLHQESVLETGIRQ